MIGLPLRRSETKPHIPARDPALRNPGNPKLLLFLDVPKIGIFRVFFLANFLTLYVAKNWQSVFAHVNQRRFLRRFSPNHIAAPFRRSSTILFGIYISRPQKKKNGSSFALRSESSHWPLGLRALHHKSIKLRPQDFQNSICLRSMQESSPSQVSFRGSLAAFGICVDRLLDARSVGRSGFHFGAASMVTISKPERPRTVLRFLRISQIHLSVANTCTVIPGFVILYQGSAFVSGSRRTKRF